MSVSTQDDSCSIKTESETSDATIDDGPPPAPIPRASTPQFKNPVTFRECFRAFSKFGDTKSDGKLITLSQSDKWMKQAKVVDGKKITTTDTGIFFKKFKQQKLTVTDYEKFLADLCKSKNLNLEETKRSMGACGQPGLTNTTTPAVPAQKDKVASTVERLTDTSKYTGSHKQRFDETGKGKGIEGRKDLSEKSGFICPRVYGYVQGLEEPFLILDPPVIEEKDEDNENEENDDETEDKEDILNNSTDAVNVDNTEMLPENENGDINCNEIKQPKDMDKRVEDETVEYDDEECEDEEDWSFKDSDDYDSS